MIAQMAYGYACSHKYEIVLILSRTTMAQGDMRPELVAALFGDKCIDPGQHRCADWRRILKVRFFRILRDYRLQRLYQVLLKARQRIG